MFAQVKRARLAVADVGRATRFATPEGEAAAGGLHPGSPVASYQLQSRLTGLHAETQAYSDMRVQESDFDLEDLRGDAFSGTAAAIAITVFCRRSSRTAR